MRNAYELANAFATDESGATAIEYGLMVALIAVGSIVAFGLLGNSISDMFGDNANSGAGAAINDATSSLN